MQIKKIKRNQGEQMRKFNVAVVGATGAVGEELFRVMEEVDFPVGELLPLASAKSVGMEIEFKGKNYKVKELTEKVFSEHEIDIAFFSAGGSVSEKFAKFAARRALKICVRIKAKFEPTTTWLS